MKKSKNLGSKKTSKQKSSEKEQLQRLNTETNTLQEQEFSEHVGPMQRLKSEVVEKKYTVQITEADSSNSPLINLSNQSQPQSTVHTEESQPKESSKTLMPPMSAKLKNQDTGKFRLDRGKSQEYEIKDIRQKQLAQNESAQDAFNHAQTIEIDQQMNKNKSTPCLSQHNIQGLVKTAGEKMLDASRGNTKVVARFRPMNEIEKQLQIENNVQIEFPYTNSVDIIDDGIPNTFTLDQVFSMDSNQSDIFDYLGEATINDIMAGYNGTIFAFGQTGAGKTFTMMGPDIFDEELQGVIPRAIMEIFNRIDNSELEIEYTLRCSMLEIYRENLRDLFEPDQCDLKIKDSPHRGIYVDGLTDVCVINAEEMFEWIEMGNGNRVVASTGMNKESSRSHSLFILEVQQKLPNGSEKKGMLNLVDLAGSEKISKTKVVGENLEEAKKINLSLSALGNVIHALTTNSEHVPYRDSKLTRLLQQSLGGNYKTSLIVACSPHPYNIEETLSTLKFASRAKSIKNKPRANIKRSPAYYQKVIKELQQELTKEKQKVLSLTQQLKMSPEEIKQLVYVQQQLNQTKKEETQQEEEQQLDKVQQQQPKRKEKQKLQPTQSQQEQNQQKAQQTEQQQTATQQESYNNGDTLQVPQSQANVKISSAQNTFMDSYFAQEDENLFDPINKQSFDRNDFFSQMSVSYDFTQQKEMMEMRIQNLLSENTALQNQVEELQKQKEDSNKKIENLKFDLIQSENKNLKIQHEHDQIRTKYQKEEENNSKQQETEKKYVKLHPNFN